MTTKTIEQAALDTLNAQNGLPASTVTAEGEELVCDLIEPRRCQKCGCETDAAPVFDCGTWGRQIVRCFECSL